MTVRVGVAGWCRAQDEVVEGVNLLEVQKTFYQPPKPSTAKRWRDKAPDVFRFTVKAWQLVTHPASSPTYNRTTRELSEDQRPQAGYFQDTDVVREGWEATVEIAELLGADLALLQCPPSFDPTDEHRDALARFVEEAKADLQLALEVRDSWKAGEVADVVDELGIAHATDPFAMPCQTPESAYFRLHGRPAEERSYGYTYTEVDLEELLATVAGTEEAWVVFNNHSMFEDAQRFRKRAQEAGLDAR